MDSEFITVLLISNYSIKLGFISTYKEPPYMPQVDQQKEGMFKSTEPSFLSSYLTQVKRNKKLSYEF
jgi:hypothetical protein